MCVCLCLCVLRQYVCVYVYACVCIGSMELLDSFGAPERTPVVAQRMIGAHLGLKIPKSVKRVSSDSPKTTVKDAWDD